jgi:hypothetical protein
MANPLAYWASSSVTKEKSFITLTPDCAKSNIPQGLAKSSRTKVKPVTSQSGDDQLKGNTFDLKSFASGIRQSSYEKLKI